MREVVWYYYYVRQHRMALDFIFVYFAEPLLKWQMYKGQHNPVSDFKNSN